MKYYILERVHHGCSLHKLTDDNILYFWDHNFNKWQPYFGSKDIFVFYLENHNAKEITEEEVMLEML